jgi:hypothetical protein
MKYYDNDDELQQYKYKMGTGVGFGGGFLHSSTYIILAFPAAKSCRTMLI